MSLLNALKERGNLAFKEGTYTSAKSLYTEALQTIDSRKRVEDSEEIDLKATILCNVAACDLKLKDYNSCVEYCSLALEINPLMSKALYRKAVALDALNQPLLAMKELSKLLHYEPKNSDAITLMRKVKAAASKEQTEVYSSEIKSVLENVKKDPSKLHLGLKSLIGLCFEEQGHALDLGRKKGISWLANVINQYCNKTTGSPPISSSISSSSNDENDNQSNIFRASASYNSSSPEKNSRGLGRQVGRTGDKKKEQGEEDDETTTGGEILLAAVRCLSAASNHKAFVEAFVDVQQSAFGATSKAVEVEGKGKGSFHVHITVDPATEKLTLLSLGNLLHFASATRNFNLLQSSIILVMTILKHTTLSYPSGPEEGGNPDLNLHMIASPECIQSILRGMLACLRVASSGYYSLVSESISALLSQHEDFFEADKQTDTRLESTAERKARLRRHTALVARSRKHTQWALDCGVFGVLVEQIDDEDSVIRHHASLCLGKLVNTLTSPDDGSDPDPTIHMKEFFSPYLLGSDDSINPEERVVELKDSDTGLHDEQPAMDICRRRAALEATLLVCQPDLGAWALRRPGGLKQLLMLVVSGDPRCQGVAAEVMCLAAANDSVSALLTPIVSSGVLTSLLHSPSAGTQAAAASTLTKLAIKAKAMTADSKEVGQVMNTVLAVLKAATGAAPISSAVTSSQQLVSFSALDTVSMDRTKTDSPAQKSKNKEEESKRSTTMKAAADNASSAVVMTSVERAIEVLAAMVGKTHVKEEIVHGSYRVKACVSELVSLDLDVRSSAAYGLAHILAALTVTNSELMAKALADKDITQEQYAQMQELQRIKTKDEDGNVIEEKKEEADPDTMDLCRRRIQRIISTGKTVSLLTKFLQSGSEQTKEASARTLRQICVEESARGLMVQQGGLKTCSSAAVDEDGYSKACRLECAHAVAKTLVTTNPNVLSEHLKLGAIKPLLLLCKDSDASNLQQFEALLSLTNILSCGKLEQDKFDAEKGVAAAYYLMFSDNLMVRRAATEALCNMAAHPTVLKLLRKRDQLRLFLGFAEEWSTYPNSNPNPNPEALLTAKAAAATVAGACGDSEVADAMKEEDCARTIVALLDSGNVDLVHRALVIVQELLSLERRDLAEHLVHGSVVPALAVTARLQQPLLVDLSKDIAERFCKLLDN